MPREKYVGQARREEYRRLTCRSCGKGWIVEKLRVVPGAGYICPKCAAKRREKH